ncbi:MAG TPA: carbon-nitrogen hydrolase family protein [Chromatiales bacterium]|nr:carbon-nitrogen hydrolase family protein [Thiotrichales bacterium]HIP69748.1 carbon-nitrogen hydrolase family protein [Chromatiales bacterium]
MNPFAAIQMSSGPQLPANLLEAERLIIQAVKQGARFIVLPENFALMGMTEQDKLEFKESPGTGQLQEFLSAQASKHKIWLLGGTIPLESLDPEKVYAASLLFNDKGEQVARYDKIHLFDVQLPDADEQYHESATTAHGDQVIVTDTDFGRVGIAVCYDLRFPEQFRSMQEMGAEIILLPAAFTMRTGKAHWELLLRARAVENLCYVVAAGQGGFHINGRATYGHSMIVDPWGSVIKTCDNSSPGVVVAPLNLDQLRAVRKNFPVLMHRKLA